MKTNILSILCFLALTLSALSQSPTPINQIGDAVSQPTNITVTTTVQLVFSTNEARSAKSGRVLMRTIQNLGTAPILYSINSTNVSASASHGVLAPGTALRDGLGSVLDLSRVAFPVYIRTESGSSIAALCEITQ